MKVLNIAFLIILGLLLAACATPPTEEMNKAQDAVTRAENDADAVTYAPNTLARAREALNMMQKEANEKRYDSAKNYANEAINNAEKAIADGKAAAARARDEAARLVNGLQTPLAETATAIDTAKQVDDIDLDFNALSDDLASARENYDNAQQSLQDNNYSDAVSKGTFVRGVLSDINSKITDGAQAVARKK